MARGGGELPPTPINSPLFGLSPTPTYTAGSLPTSTSNDGCVLVLDLSSAWQCAAIVLFPEPGLPVEFFTETLRRTGGLYLRLKLPPENAWQAKTRKPPAEAS